MPASQSTNRRKAKATIVALVIGSAVFNVIWGMLLLKGLPESEFMMCIASGLGIAQICLLSVWCALGTQKLVVRVPLTMGILLGLTCVFLATMASDDYMPIEVPIIYLGMTYSLALLIQIPLWIFRIKTGFGIGPLGINHGREVSSQFGIKHLLITTAIAAVSVAVVQRILNQNEFDASIDFRDILGFVTTIELFISLITLLCAAWVFSNHNRITIGCLLGGVCLLGPVAVCRILDAVDPGGDEMLRNTYGFSISLAATVSAILFAFYLQGYRLKNRSSS